MKISIVIATYNAEKLVAKTLQSIYMQSEKNIEIILIDGKSVDNTLEIAEEYRKKYGKINIVSEKDSGIYNAMNKGINIASGDYILFMGAGDLLYSEYTLESIAFKPDDEIVYGNVVINGEFQICNNKMNMKYFFKRHPICHQQVVAKTELLKQNYFDETYKIAADQDWIMRMYKQRHRFRYIDLPICLFDSCGISNTGETRKVGIKEFKDIQKNYYPIFYYVRESMLWIKSNLVRV